MAKRITIDFVSNGEQCCFYDCGVENLHFNIYKDIVYKVAGNFSDLEGMDCSELYLQTGIEGLIRCKNNIVEATDQGSIFKLISMYA